MPRFRIVYGYKEGPDHHSQDYMDPDVAIIDKTGSVTIEAANKEEAKVKFKGLCGHSLDAIVSIEETQN